jgi:hypothetical protein
MAVIERLPWQGDRRVMSSLGILSDLEVCPSPTDAVPHVRGVLAAPLAAKASLVVRVHSRAGIPLASASVDLKPGDREFEAGLTLLAMEGYAHLSRRARQEVERRVWSRRAYATGSAA